MSEPITEAGKRLLVDLPAQVEMASMLAVDADVGLRIVMAEWIDALLSGAIRTIAFQPDGSMFKSDGTFDTGTLPERLAAIEHEARAPLLRALRGVYNYAQLASHDCKNDGAWWRDRCPVAAARDALGSTAADSPADIIRPGERER